MVIYITILFTELHNTLRKCLRFSNSLPFPIFSFLYFSCSVDMTHTIFKCNLTALLSYLPLNMGNSSTHITLRRALFLLCIQTSTSTDSANVYSQHKSSLLLSYSWEDNLDRSCHFYFSSQLLHWKKQHVYIRLYQQFSNQLKFRFPGSSLKFNIYEKLVSLGKVQ